MAIEAILPKINPGIVGAGGAGGMAGVGGAAGVGAPGATPGAGFHGESDFETRLESAIRGVSDTQNTSDVRLSRLASGEDVDIHTTMIAMQEADISLRLMVASRDKVVDAYQQVMNMSI